MADEGLPFQHVGVNVSSADFYTEDLSTKIDEAFARSGVPLNYLSIEVTENVYFGQRDRVVATGIADLRMKGVHVALDDFGTGFAALTHLLTVPIDMIKIDKSFIRGLEPGDSGTAIVRGLLQIAHDLALARLQRVSRRRSRLRACVPRMHARAGYVSSAVQRKGCTIAAVSRSWLAGAGPLSPASGASNARPA
jgi:predicted signal transduction protein with EAL and GGDEF domain